LGAAFEKPWTPRLKALGAAFEKSWRRFSEHPTAVGAAQL